MSRLFDIRKVFEREANAILDKLRQNFAKKDLIATGKTVNSLRAEVLQTGFQIWGADWIEAAEYGRGPAKQSGGDFLNNLIAWAEARGFPLARVEWLKYYINKFGTRLWRGQDKRFTGKQSGVLTEVLNEKLVSDLQEILTMAVLTNFQIYIRKQNEY